MMANNFELTCIFICAKPYRFTNEDGRTFEGVNVFLLDSKNDIIKAKAISNEFTKYKLGDHVAVSVSFYGDRVKFEI